MAVIGFHDVETSVGRSFTPTEQAQVAQWIGFAEKLIEARLGDLAALDQGLLAYVVTEAVALRVKRPDGATQVYTQVDNTSMSRSYEKASGQITILDEWWALLSPAGDSGAGYSTRPAFEPDTPPVDLWS